MAVAVALSQAVAVAVVLLAVRTQLFPVQHYPPRSERVVQVLTKQPEQTVLIQLLLVLLLPLVAVLAGPMAVTVLLVVPVAVAVEQVAPVELFV